MIHNFKSGRTLIQTFLIYFVSSGIWTSCLAQGTIYVSGTITGKTTWSADTVKVTGFLSVDSLVIEPGTVVEFQTEYGLFVEKYLNAIGEIGDTILFTAKDTTGFSDPDIRTGGWGGIGGRGKIILEYCKIQYVKKFNSNGGAVHGYGYGPVSVDILNSCITNNFTTGVYQDYGNLNISKSLITNNKGQGILFEFCTLKVNECIIRNNSGGGIFPHYYGKLFVENSTIELNGNYGIKSSESSLFYIISNIIQNNRGSGIIRNSYEYPNKGVVMNNIIRFNDGYGITLSIGGIIPILNNLIVGNSKAGVSLGSTSCTLVNNTIINNSNGITIIDATIQMYNCICRDNNTREGEQNINFYYPEATMQSKIYNSNIEGLNTNYFDGEFVNNIDTDPQFVDTTNFDFHLSDYSPCINAGTSDTTGLNLPGSDLDGNPRVFDGRIDMGAFEYQHDNFHILKQPVSQVVCVEATATLETEAIGGVVGYQWQKNGADIPSANQCTLTFNPVSLNDSGHYHCLIIADDKTVSTDTIIISIDTGINIESQSDSFSICPGKDALIYVTVSGSRMQDYSWSKNDNILPDATESELIIPSPPIQQQDIYHCTISNACGSVVSGKITVTALNIPDPPISNDITICEGQQVPDLNASGENIKWYSDAELTNPVYSGSNFNTGHSNHGLYVYYVSQSVSGCESTAGMIKLTINRLPVISLGEDSTISTNQTFILGPFTDSYSYSWNNNSESPYFEISGNDLGPGSHTISVMVTDTNTCQNSDTMIVNVVPYSNTGMTQNNNLLRIFPNPTGGLLNIEVSDFHDEDIIVKLFNQQSEEIFSDKIYVENKGGTIQLNMTSLPAGIYYLQIITNNGQYVGKVVLQ